MDELVAWFNEKSFSVGSIVSILNDSTSNDNYLVSLLNEVFGDYQYESCKYDQRIIIGLSCEDDSLVYKLCFSLYQKMLQESIRIYIGISCMNMDTMESFVSDSLGALFRAKKQALPIAVGIYEKEDHLQISVPKDFKLIYENLSYTEKSDAVFSLVGKIYNVMSDKGNKKIYINYQEDSTIQTASDIKNILNQAGYEGFYINNNPGIASGGIEYILSRLSEIAKAGCLLLLSNSNTLKRDSNFNLDMNTIDNMTYITKGDLECCNNSGVVVKVVFCNDITNATKEIRMIIHDVFGV